MLMGEGSYGLQYDIWSLGALMFALITQRVPFYSNDRQQREVRVCREPLDTSSDPLLRRMSFEAKDLLHMMLAKDPNERYTILGVARHPWFDNFNEDGLDENF